MTIASKSNIITSKDNGGKEMSNLVCPICFKKGAKPRESVFVPECTQDAELVGILKCLNCGHELPITIRNGFTTKTDEALPGAQSENLHQSVPQDIREDIREVEMAHYHQCDKACVTMCRRALQLSLIDKEISDKPFLSFADDLTPDLPDIKRLVQTSTTSPFGLMVFRSQYAVSILLKTRTPPP